MELGKDNLNDNRKFYVLDTSFFIKIRPLDLLEDNIYICTQYIINEIRDKNAREYYNMKKSFIKIVNPSKESMKHVSQFAKKSNDLSYLSIADLSVIALAYETIYNIGKDNLLNKEPLNYTIIDKDKIDAEIRKKEKEREKELKKKEEEENEDNGICWNDNGDDEDEGDWITPENLNTKLSEMTGIREQKIDVETEKCNDKNTENKIKNNNNTNNQENNNNENKENKNTKVNLINVYIYTTDYTLQNVSLKMGIPVIGLDGFQIKKIKNYIYKCIVCENFIFDTSKKFCDMCGYPELMKIGYNIYSDGNIRINDKKPEIRKRGKQFDLPKPKLGKKGVIYILAEDQIPKKKYDQEVNIDKILENYSEFKELSKPENDLLNSKSNSSKQYIWGYPKQNPNKAKKYHNKRKK